MTYEQMMLSIFSRYRGQTLGRELISKIQDDCQREVWCHLPPGIQESWKLSLALGESGDIELRPQQLKKGIVGELESALGSEFRERGPSPSAPAGGEKASSEPEKKEKDEPRGGIAAVSVAFGSPDPSPVARPDSRSSHLGNRETEPMRPLVPSVARGEEASAPNPSLSDAAIIESMAKDLGISLPPNASLLGPFLAALTKAHEFKQRAEAAEAKVEQFTRLIQDQD